MVVIHISYETVQLLLIIFILVQINLLFPFLDFSNE